MCSVIIDCINHSILSFLLGFEQLQQKRGHLLQLSLSLGGVLFGELKAGVLMLESLFIFGFLIGRNYVFSNKHVVLFCVFDAKADFGDLLFNFLIKTFPIQRRTEIKTVLFLISLLLQSSSHF